ncbi:MAG: Phosphoglycerate kinase [Candidatus Carbobacillus altaicus]|uniref:Phosphoglycerate kinase n=1 Tax=Candidatus Carbonibacillus altaicus TaxID=2163959 RepID=A0A2R6XYA1_9BACL|nr:MAG: Phosphoglycerate kinase [Candidatus Carbobacillus altaicus]
MKKTIRDVQLQGKTVFLRVDFNVPLDGERITDDTRIVKALPTIEMLREQGARIVLASHLGRPKGEVDPRYSLKPVAQHLSQLLGVPVPLSEELVGPAVAARIQALRPGELLMLENVRFHPGETKNDPELARTWASYVDLFVNDAFGSAHRAHASTVGVGTFVPAVAGLLMARELEVLGGVLKNPKRPLVAIIGGAKIKDKIGVLENLLGLVDRLLIGGGMANTFLLAQGYDLGASLVEEDQVDTARRLMQEADARGVRVYLPQDVVVAERFSADAAHRTVPVGHIPSGWMALDIGPQTVEIFKAALQDAAMVVWNGPLGAFELAPFAAGTMAIAQALSTSKGETIVGGGDSVAAIEAANVAESISHISTGGGATLEFLEGKTLPGVAILQDLE